MPRALDRAYRRAWVILSRAFKIFSQIEGAPSAAAFAYYALFSLFPLVILFVTIASVFIDRDQAGIEVLAYIKTYVPITGEMQRSLFDTLGGIVNARGPASVVAFLLLVWGALQLFTTLIITTNRAWGAEAYAWWQLPIKSLVFLCIMCISVFSGITISLIIKTGTILFTSIISLITIFLSYRISQRKPINHYQLLTISLFISLLIQFQNYIFMIYIDKISKFNIVYGTLGAIMALLLWIYFSGCIFIFGACLCSAQTEDKVNS